MALMEEKNRQAIYMTSLDDGIDEAEEVKVYDKIIEEIDLKKIGFKERERKNNAGRPEYPTKAMIKLLCYGFRLGIRSGRKLERACKYDKRIEWLLKGLKPDANTINDFRKDNRELLPKAFYEVNRMMIKMGILKLNNGSQDGYKIKANNSKEKNYTVNKVADRIKREEKAIETQEEEKRKIKEEVKNFEEYLDTLEKAEELEEIEKKIEEKKKELEEIDEEINTQKARKEKHTKIIEKMKKEGKTQISLTDKECKLMKNNGKYDTAYNIQEEVDMESHMVSAFELDNNPADIGSMQGIAEKIKEEYGEEEVVYNTTDKGYNSVTDMMESLEKGVVPQVTPIDKKTKSVELETEYEEAEITEEMKKSKKSEDIKRCLKSGVIPECYKEDIEEIKVEEVKKETEVKGEYIETRSEGEIRETAIINKTFERDMNTGLVYCPEGEILGKKSTNKRTKRSRYCNKLACKNCKNPCTDKKFKVVEYGVNQTRVVPKTSEGERSRIRGPKKVEMKKVVKIKLKIEEGRLKQRMGTSEHPQGTMKVADNFNCFYVRGKKAAEADVAVYYIGYNIRRAINIVGVEKMLEKLAKLDNIIEEKTEKMKEKVVNLQQNCGKVLKLGGDWYNGIVKKLKTVLKKIFCPQQMINA